MPTERTDGNPIACLKVDSKYVYGEPSFWRTARMTRFCLHQIGWGEVSEAEAMALQRFTNTIDLPKNAMTRSEKCSYDGHSNLIPDSVIQAPRITESTKSTELRSRDLSSAVTGIIFRDKRDGDDERL